MPSVYKPHAPTAEKFGRRLSTPPDNPHEPQVASYPRRALSQCQGASASTRASTRVDKDTKQRKSTAREYNQCSHGTPSKVREQALTVNITKDNTAIIICQSSSSCAPVVLETRMKHPCVQQSNERQLRSTTVPHQLRANRTSTPRLLARTNGRWSSDQDHAAASNAIATRAAQAPAAVSTAPRRQDIAALSALDACQTKPRHISENSVHAKADNQKMQKAHLNCGRTLRPSKPTPESERQQYPS